MNKDKNIFFGSAILFCLVLVICFVAITADNQATADYGNGGTAAIHQAARR